MEDIVDMKSMTRPIESLLESFKKESNNLEVKLALFDKLMGTVNPN